MMRTLARLRSALRSLLWTARVEREIEDEFRFAEDELVARYVDQGLAREAAVRAARSDLGRTDRLREEVRVRGLSHRCEAWTRDIQQAWRGLRRTPVFTALVVTVLACGIGAATAIFSVVNGLLLQPLPYRDADRLVFVWQDLSKEYRRAPLAGPELKDLRDRSTLFSAFGGIWANTVALTDGTEPEQLRIGLVTPNFFDVLGAEASLGRTFRDGDEAADAAPSILLSHALWTRRYGGDSAVVGKPIQVNGRPTTVLGIMPPGFRLLLPADSAIPDDQQAWLLLSRSALRWPRQQQFARVVGRMKPGVELSDAQQEIAAIAQRVGREFPEYGASGLTLYGVGLQADATREIRPALLVLFAAVCLLLTIGCVNVAGLLVTRATARQYETAVRLAIGAGRARLFRQCLAEGLLLSLMGGVAGVAAAQGLLTLLLSVRPASLSRMDLTQLDLRVLAFSLGISIVWGVLFSLAPFAQVFKTTITGLLTGGGRGAVGTAATRARSLLVVLQVAITSVLLVTAVLLAKGFYQLQHIDAGFVDAGVLTFKLSASGPRYRGAAAVTVFSQQFRQRLAAIPGVTGVGAISHLPYDTVPNWGTPYLPEHGTDVTVAGLADARAVTPGYFEALGVELVEGRGFSESDTAGSLPVAIVDSVFAGRMWPTGSAIGQRFKADPGTTGTPSVLLTVVGVVKHLRHREISSDLREQVYFPAGQSFRNPMAYAIKANVDPSSLAPAVRAALAELDRTLPIYDVRPLSAYTRDALAVRAFTVLLAVTFAVSALLLAAVGIYGVTAYAASQRRREFGVRLALGADGRQVASLVLRDAMRLAAGGTVLGGAAAVAAAQLLRSQLGSSLDPLTPGAFLAGAGLVVIAAMVASAVPAYRAARTSPLASLRTD